MHSHYIYKITNLTTGEYYYGKRSYKGDWRRDKYMGSGTVLKRKMQKHPDHEWRKEVLLLLESEQEAFEYERVVIGDRYKTDPLCLNLCAGGDGGIGTLEKSAEHKAKIGAAHVGMKRGAETRAKMSKIHKGKIVPPEKRRNMSAGKVKGTVKIIKNEAIYEVRDEQLVQELREGATFAAPHHVNLHHEGQGVWVQIKTSVARDLVILDAGWKHGTRSYLRQIRVSDIDKATGLLR